MDNTSPAVSIVVTSYTMERYNDLTELLDSLQEQTYRNFETVLVTEKSSELFEKLKVYIQEKGYFNTRVLFNTGPQGLSPSRNLGIKEAKGDIITFTDDDALPFPEWLEEIVKTFAGDDSVISVTGLALPLWQEESMNWFPEEFYWVIGCTAFSKLTEVEEVRNAWGANMSFAKEAFALCGLFNENDFGSSIANTKGKQGLIGDDTEFSLRLRRETGKRILYNPRVKIRHKVYRFRLAPKFMRRYAYQHAYSKAFIKRFYSNGHDKDVLAREYQLLKRILLRLLPGILVGFFKQPVVSWRRLVVTATVLFYTALGYFMATLRRGKLMETR